jgi:hypothetical protein
LAYSVSWRGNEIEKVMSAKNLDQQGDGVFGVWPLRIGHRWELLGLGGDLKCLRKIVQK